MDLVKAKAWMEENQRILTVVGAEENILFFRCLNGNLQFRKTGEEWALLCRGLRWLSVEQYGYQLGRLDQIEFKIPDEDLKDANQNFLSKKVNMINWILDHTYEKLCRLGMMEIKGLRYLDKHNWPGDQRGLPSWCFLWADGTSGRWIPIPIEFANSIVNDAAKDWWFNTSLDPSQPNRIRENSELSSVGRYDPDHVKAGEDGFVWFDGKTVGQAVVNAYLGERKNPA